MSRSELSFKQRLKKTPVTTWVFRGILAFLLLASITAAFILYGVLTDYLVGYENARPEYLAEEYFDRLFCGEDYKYLYSELGINPEGPVSEKEFDLYLSKIKGDGEFNYKKVSSGLSEESKFEIYLDNKNIGEFVLKPSGEKNDAGFDLYEKSNISLYWTPENAYIIRVQKGSEVRVNGALLNEEYVTESGTLINGDYEIYTVNGLYNAPSINVKLNGEECYITKTTTERVYTDEVFGKVTDAVSTTIRVIKGHSVYADGEKVGDDCLVKEAEGYIEGFYKGTNKLEYVLYSIPKTVNELKVFDEENKEVAIRKIEGSRIYSECALDKEGDLEIYVLSNSELFLSGCKIGSEYITESKLKTESCEYMLEGVSGNLYNKFLIHWVGEMPEYKVVNFYGKEAGYLSGSDFSDTANKDAVVESPYDDDLISLFSNELLTISKKYSKMMIRYENKSSVLSHFLVDSDGYEQVDSISITSLSKPHSYKISEGSAFDFCRYEGDVYSGKVSYEVTTVKYSIEQTLKFNYTFYFKYVDGKIFVFNMANNGG